MCLFHSLVYRLLNRRADGTFLVRESTNFPGDFTLSLACQGKVSSSFIQLLDSVVCSFVNMWIILVILY